MSGTVIQENFCIRVCLLYMVYIPGSIWKMLVISRKLLSIMITAIVRMVGKPHPATSSSIFFRFVCFCLDLWLVFCWFGSFFYRRISSKFTKCGIKHVLPFWVLLNLSSGGLKKIWYHEIYFKVRFIFKIIVEKGIGVMTFLLLTLSNCEVYRLCINHLGNFM